jgi:hypothetical protein
MSPWSAGLLLLAAFAFLLVMMLTQAILTP